MTATTATTRKSLTAAQLRSKYEEHNPHGHFFSRETMKFFGDTMSNYGVRYHAEHNAYELHRKRPVKHGNQESAFFDANTFSIRHDFVQLQAIPTKSATYSTLGGRKLKPGYIVTLYQRACVNEDGTPDYATTVDAQAGQQAAPPCPVSFTSAFTDAEILTDADVVEWFTKAFGTNVWA